MYSEIIEDLYPGSQECMDLQAIKLKHETYYNPYIVLSAEVQF